MSEQNSNNDQSFNDAELQDIMNEIESLEKEFVEEEQSPDIESQASSDDDQVEEREDVHAEQEHNEETHNDKPHEQIASHESSDDEINAEPEFEEDTEDEHDNVVPLSRSTDSQEEGHMRFSASGNMNCELNFNVGESEARLSVSENKLTVTMGDVELVLGESGCEVTMQGGAKFSVPVSSQNQKKKAA